jgi:D-glycero-D-manno-heptose 1,7-bisphosphate phosphatase
LREQDQLPLRTRQPAVFCDRDGVLNVRRPDHVKSWAEFEFLPGTFEALARLAALQVPVILVTNQSVLGRGLTSAEALEEIHRKMQEHIRAQGGPELAVYVCPHAAEDSCACRKPRPGLLYQATADLGLDLQRSVFIGDSFSDVLAAFSAGCRCILVGDGESAAVATHLSPSIICVPSLAEAVERIMLDPAFAVGSDHATPRIFVGETTGLDSIRMGIDRAASEAVPGQEPRTRSRDDGLELAGADDGLDLAGADDEVTHGQNGTAARM